MPGMVRHTVALALVALGGCYATPPLGAPKTPATVLQRVFASDLSTAGFADRWHGATALLQVVAHEPTRLDHSKDRAETIAGHEATRLAHAAPRLRQLTGTELAHQPSPSTLRVLLPNRSVRLERSLVRDTRQFAFGTTFLGDIDDERHRTDPDDDAPEATLLARLCRRLRL